MTKATVATINSPERYHQFYKEQRSFLKSIYLTEGSHQGTLKIKSNYEIEICSHRQNPTFQTYDFLSYIILVKSFSYA